MATNDKVWNVYFREKGFSLSLDDLSVSEDWEWQCSIPAMVVETVEKDGKTIPGDQWYNDGDEPDLGEGRAAMLVLQNQRIGLESRYAWEPRKKGEAREPVPVTFNCKLH